MKRFQARVSGLLSAAALAIVLGVGSTAGVAHAEPGPRPTLTPVPPVPAPPVEAPVVAPPVEAPVVAPPVEAPVAPREEEQPAPTPKPRRMITAVVTPIAPVRPATGIVEPAAVEAPIAVEVTNVHVRYVAPAEAATAPQSTVAPSAISGLINYRSLLVSLIALDIMGICVLLRRRVVAK